MHVIKPGWIMDPIRAMRMDDKTNELIIDEQDQIAVNECIRLWMQDKPQTVQWERFHTVAELLAGVQFDDTAKTCSVAWDSHFGRIIRMNKLRYMLWIKPDTGRINMPIKSLKDMFFVVLQKVGETLKNEIRIITWISSALSRTK